MARPEDFPRVVDANSNEVLNLEKLLVRPDLFVQEVGNSHWFAPRSGRLAHLLAIIWSIREGKSVVYGLEQLSASRRVSLEFLDRVYQDYGKEALYMFLTSGSTGFPKMVAHSHENLFEAVNKLVSALPVLEEGPYWHIFPHFYMAGVLNVTILPWLVGQEIVLSDSFSASTPFQFAGIAQKFGLKNLWLSPTMIKALSLRTKREDWRNVTQVINATGPISQEIHADFVERFDTDLYNSYGSTEQLFISVAREGRKFSGVGEVLDGVSLEFLSESSREESRFRICSQTTALAILERKDSFTDRTAHRREAKCILSADVGLMSDGNLWLTGRADDVVVIGGENVSLHQYEMIAKEVPGVVEAVARSRDSFHFSSIDLFIELSTDVDYQSVTNEVNSRLSQLLGPQRSPGRLVLGPIPRLKNGKPDRQKVRGGSP